MNLREVLTKDCVVVGMEAASATEAITRLVDVLARSGRLADRALVLEAVLDRERMRSTGIGEGLAVPHGKSPGTSCLAMAVGKPVVPVDFGARDGVLCNLVVLLVSPPDTTGPHIQALARVSRLWLTPGFRQAVARAGTVDELYEVMMRQEGRMA